MIPGKQPEAKAVSLVVSNDLTCVSCHLKLEVESGDFRSKVRRWRAEASHTFGWMLLAHL